ncbi:hypothetical protein [Peribacillus deserti]|uniref:hypothetical protein n=1 Tax=Peribacillus deserti TaxID=673318 RepID=UPI0021524285|nr:hypothetical protein [Peribacillus deserti]
MLKVLSTSALSLALAGSLVLPGLQSAEKTLPVKRNYDLELAHHVGVAPELAE